PYGLRKPAVVIIGPEGGFIPFEIAKFREADCEIVNLGERILKVETAVVALLAKIY
ncbi:MAG: RNA methyltransferase, partial [Candidatus Omnitrophica bacterium]|nr:RNA methyltransferase [Candidatus Omnitrophota bacterium]